MNVSTFHSLFSRRFFSHFLVCRASFWLLRPRSRDCCAMLQD
jgi:hypothetical protein